MTNKKKPEGAGSKNVFYLVLVDNDKVTAMQKPTSRTSADEDSPDTKPVGTLLPTAMEGISHIAVRCGAAFGEQGVWFFGVVDSRKDLYLPISDAVTKMRDKGWEVSNFDNLSHWAMREYIASLQ